MKLFRNTALAIVVVIALNILISSLIEWNAITSEIHALESTVRVAGEHAIGEFEITQFSGFDDNLGQTFDIDNTHNQTEYKQYLSTIKHEAQSKMGSKYEDSDMQLILEFLEGDLTNFCSGQVHNVLSPFAFSLTFLEEEKLNTDFNETVTSLIEHNYNPKTDDIQKSEKSVNPLAFSGPETVEIVRTSAKIIDGPKMLDLTQGVNTGTEKYAAFAKIFGTENRAAMNMVNGIHLAQNMFNYVVYYDVEFTIDWNHHTRTLFYKSAGFGKHLAGDYIDDRGQIVVPMKPIVLQKRYIVTN